MSATDLDRYLTDEVVEQAAVAIQLAASIQGEVRLVYYLPEYEDLPDEHKRQRQHEARSALAAVLPDIIQQAKAEALESLLGRVPEIIRPYAGNPEFWEGYINAVKVEALREVEHAMDLAHDAAYRSGMDVAQQHAAAAQAAQRFIVAQRSDSEHGDRLEAGQS